MKEKLTFAVFTDNHLHSPSDSVFLRMLENIKQLGDAEKIEAVVSLGDNFAMLGRERCASNEEIGTMLCEIMDNVYATAGVPVFAINGNHDGIGTDFFDTELWNRAVGKKYSCGLDVHDADSVYYYVDYPEKELRLVFLSLPCGSDLSGECPVPLWEFGEKQLKWLKEKALDVGVDTDVLLFCHVPTFYNFPRPENEPYFTVFNGKVQCKTKLSALCGYINDRDAFLDIVHAFDQNKNTGRLLCMISGHNHVDRVILPNADCLDSESLGAVNQLPCPQVLVKKAITDGAIGYAFDVVTVENDRIFFKRFGDGEDKEVTLKKKLG